MQPLWAQSRAGRPGRSPGGSRYNTRPTPDQPSGRHHVHDPPGAIDKELAILARILKDRGIVTERQLQEAIQHQVLYGGRLGTNLYELGFITEERLQEALARAHGVPGIAVDLREIEPEAVDIVPKAIAARHKVFPYRVRGQDADPADGGPGRPRRGGADRLRARLHRDAGWWCPSSG